MQKLIVSALAAAAGIAAAGAVSAAEMLDLPATKVDCAVTPAKMRNIVFDAALEYKWEVIEETAGRTVLKYARGSKFFAEIEVKYTPTSFKINYLRSYGLSYEKNKHGTVEIHRNYNRWIRNLEKEIRVNAQKQCRR